jgi:phosphoglycolate phosphatase
MAEYVVKICEKLYGKDTFEVLMGPDGITPKPNPMGALIAAEKMGVSPADVAYVGDSVTDMKTGLAAGMHTVGVSWGFTAREDLVSAGAHKIADTVDGLREILTSL